MQVEKWFPISTVLSSYSKADFRADLMAGLTVGVMLIPQGMAYAMLAGLPPIYGLYAALVPIVSYALLGSSRQLAVGPVAMDSLLTAASVAVLAQAGTDHYIALALALAFMVGVIQMAFGIFRLGFVVSFLSQPVISGFTSAAALIIAASQLKHLFGISIESSPFIHDIFIQIGRNISALNIYAFLIGAGGMLLIYSLKKINRMWPSQLIAVLLGILIVWLSGMDAGMLPIVGEVPTGLPSFSWHHFDREMITQLLPAAFAIALISFMESYAVSRSVQARHNDYKIDANQELRALGLANMLGSLFQSFSVSGGFSRTAVNDEAGARTQLASIISALLIALTLLFLTPVFYYLPKAILASIIIIAVWGLIDMKEGQFLWRSNRHDFWMMMISFMATLVLGIVQGIASGVILSLGLLIYKSTRPHIAILARIPGTDIYRNTDRFSNLEDREDLLILRFDAPLYFANSAYFKSELMSYLEEKERPVKAVIINCESISDIDSTAMHMLEELHGELAEKGVRIYFSGMIGPARDRMQAAGMFERFGHGCFTLNVDQAVRYIDQHPDAEVRFKPYTTQSNY